MKKRYIIAFIITLGILWLTNPYWLVFKSKSHAHFEFYIFTIILICGYLLSLKLTEYLVDFKELKHQSRIEIVFLAVFFALLFIPMSHIDYNTVKSENENRNLAKYKPLFEKDYKINYNFGNDFNSWYNDRFNLRTMIINFYTLHVKYKFSEKWLNINETIYNKKTHWTFKTSHINYDKHFYSDEFPDEIAIQLNKLEEFCNTNNIKLYILIVPYNVEVYYEELFPYIDTTRMQYNKNQVIANIIEKASANIIYPYNELKKQTKYKQIYYKMEHHWTDDGAYIGYLELMKEIKKDFPQVSITPLSEYELKKSKLTRGDWSRKFGLGEIMEHDIPALIKYKSKILDKKYVYYDNKNKKLLNKQVVNNEEIRKKEFYYSNGGNLRVIQMGSSMNESLLQFTPYSFKNLKYLRLNGVKQRPNNEEYKIMKYYKNEILEYKPDILIFCITPLNLLQAENWFKE